MMAKGGNIDALGADSQRKALLDACLDLAADEGLLGVSLRSIAAGAGRSTTVIFQHFGDKQSLLEATLEHAIARSHARHMELAATLVGVPQDERTLGGVVASYILSLSRDPATRLCLDALYNSAHFPAARGHFQAWDTMRRDFWRAVFGAGPFAPLADVVATYSVTELGFATALHQEPVYSLLLQETIAGLFKRRPDGDAPAIDWARARTFPQDDRPAPTPAMADLLDRAAQVVIELGPAGLNPRRLATQAGVPPSLIVYHYGDFAAFVRAAIWRAIMQGLPRYLDLAQAGANDRSGDAAWLVDLADSTRPADEQAPAGFYVRYARTLGHLGLLAQRQTEFLPLLLQLRAIEGMGIHPASQSRWPDRYRLGIAGAAAFAIWMKGRALLNDSVAMDAEPEAGQRQILDTLVLLAP
jgi:AcrR family transcriptional regulator